ncbi:MAG: hypothetical protein AB7O73_06040 [Bacteroidia bacterium]
MEKEERKKIVFFLYNRLNDPLIQSNIFLYINQLIKNHEPFKISIVSFEDPDFPLTDNQLSHFKQLFDEANVDWKPVKWHKGDGFFIKLTDVLNSFFIIFKFRLKGYKHFISLGSIAGAFIGIVSKLIPLKYYLYQYEPHSEYLLDANIWNAKSWQFRWLQRFERLSIRHASVISSGTEAMQIRLKNEGIRAPFFKVTSVANDNLFKYSEQDRDMIRKKLGISADEKLIIYPGKIGGIYASVEQIYSIIKEFLCFNDQYRALIITPQKTELAKLVESNLSKKIIILLPIEYTEMPVYLSASDIGIVSALPVPSKKFSSNIKVGEYLCSGLPYIVCRGVSEDDLVADEFNVGVVINDFNSVELREKKEQIFNLLSEDRNVVAQRCRNVGLNYRGFENQYNQFLKALRQLVN